MQTLNAAFTRGAAKPRQRREARVAPLAIGHLNDNRFFQLIDAEYAVIEGLRIALDQIEIFRTIFQPFQLFGDLRQIGYHDRVTRRAIQRGEVRGVFKADIVINFRQQYATKTFRQRVKARIFRPSRLAEAFDLFVDSAFTGAHFVAFDDGFALALQQLLEIFSDILA